MDFCHCERAKRTKQSTIQNLASKDSIVEFNFCLIIDCHDFLQSLAMTKRGLSSMQSMQDYRFTNVDMLC
ncbi:hypothetical protein [Helicobacter rodentium]|uniref:hypothetical protein n=1 Tax=Helicobacter rodentium TaxID=59617 RepID=UPI0012EB6C32|nr:hypothetical protein [Helicobacter rodentium]